MTEEEAKTKWCPFGRMAFQYRAGASNGNCMIVANRAEQDEPLTLCVASACMAWRLGRDKTDVFVKATGARAESDRAYGKDDLETRIIEPAGGYCGLAGGQP